MRFLTLVALHCLVALPSTCIYVKLISVDILILFRLGFVSCKLLVVLYTYVRLVLVDL